MSSEKRIEQFLADHGQEVNEETHTPADTFYPPIPLQPQPGAALTGSSLIIEMIPALARIVVELDRDAQRRVNFQPGCPARLTLEALVGQVILKANTRADQARLIFLARLVRHSLEIADELHQMDGSAALSFAAGFVGGEVSQADLFAGQEAESQALVAALGKCRADLGGRPFQLGFQTRRDQLRQARMSSLEGI